MHQYSLQRRNTEEALFSANINLTCTLSSNWTCLEAECQMCEAHLNAAAWQRGNCQSGDRESLQKNKKDRMWFFVTAAMWLGSAGSYIIPAARPAPCPCKSTDLSL